MGLIDDFISLDTWRRNRGDGPKLAEVNSDIGSATGPEDYDFIRRTLPTYAINSPTVVNQASGDIDKALANYKLNKTLEKALADQEKLNKGITEFGSLYPDWRQEVGDKVPRSQFYSDYAGRIDPQVTTLEPYQKAVAEYTGGISEGENRGITAQEHVSKLQGQANLAKYIANTQMKPGVEGWNKFVEGMYALPNVDTTEVRNVLKDMEGRNSGPTGNIKTYATQTGPTTSVHKVDTDMFGRPVANTGVTATNTPPQAAPAKPGDMDEWEKELWKDVVRKENDALSYAGGKVATKYDETGTPIEFSQVDVDPNVLAQKRTAYNAANGALRDYQQKKLGKGKSKTGKVQPPAGFSWSDKYQAYVGMKDGKMVGWKP